MRENRTASSKPQIKPLSEKHWKLTDVSWQCLDPTKVHDQLKWIVRATCLVESRADLYAAYVANVLSPEPDGEALSGQMASWGVEEAQHGSVLARWLAVADPDFPIETHLSEYLREVDYYVHTGCSVRGSIELELFCRCVVEALASAYYRAIRDATDEPLLKEICDRLARDEARHFAMFRRLMDERYPPTLQAKARRCLALLRRVRDLENDQIAYAFYCCNRSVGSQSTDTAYAQKRAARSFLPVVYGLYRAAHVEYAGHMILRAIGIKLPKKLVRVAARFVIGTVRLRSYVMRFQMRICNKQHEASAKSAGELAFNPNPINQQSRLVDGLRKCWVQAVGCKEQTAVDPLSVHRRASLS